MKRGINGVYHHIGQQHLHRYLSDFDISYIATKKLTLKWPFRRGRDVRETADDAGHTPAKLGTKKPKSLAPKE